VILTNGRRRVPIYAIVVVDFLRGTVRALNDAIQYNLYAYLTRLTVRLLERTIIDPFTDGVNFLAILADISAARKRLEAIPNLSPRDAFLMLGEVDAYRAELETVIGWVNDIKGSVVYSTLQARFSIEHLNFQRRWNARPFGLF
jgi:hypothetical protein